MGANGNAGPKKPKVEVISKGEAEKMADVEKISKPELQEITPKEKTTHKIAMMLVLGFLILLGVPFVYLLRGNVSEAIDLIKTVASALSGLVGAVFGYYFRTGEQS